MSQCLPWKQLRCLLIGSTSAKSCGERSKGLAVSGKEWSSWVGRDLLEAVQIFRRHCKAAVQATDKGDVALPLVEAAAHLVESLLTGIKEQLTNLDVDIEVRALQVYREPTKEREIVTLEVKFATTSPLVGEIATRSRVAVNVQVSGKLRFALEHLPANPRDRPLVLRVDGLEMPTLPDCVSARTQLREALGEGLNPVSAYEWWEKHRHTRFPLQTSKFHRVVESLLEQRGMKLLGVQICAESFWGYLHTTDLNIEVFNFHLDRRMRGGVALTAQSRPPRTNAEAADREEVKVITQKILRDNRASADRLAPSGINVGAMYHGPEVGQPGACPRVIAKLFSPARWWGPGEDSWHRWDESWLCTDKKDFFGRVVKQQGRIIWREGQLRESSPTWDAGGPADLLDTTDDDAEPRSRGALDKPRLIGLALIFFLLVFLLYPSR
mmetsp:Transcript_102092/g.284236  ORF Transcript_102092/g.284236 Transcript_102092/m.284236 type:complete len:439 (-) Transcript_102092:144-1460(-)